jgi:hypothetical protein
MRLLRQPIDQLKRIGKPDRHRSSTERGEQPVVIASAAAQAGGGGGKCDSGNANQGGAEFGPESFGFQRPDGRRLQYSKSAGTQFAWVGHRAEQNPASGAIGYRIVELPLRAQRLGCDKGSFDFATERRVENDLRGCVVGSTGKETPLHARR